MRTWTKLAFVLAFAATAASPAFSAGSVACLSSQIAAVDVTQSARTLDGAGRGADQTGTYRNLIADDVQAIGLPVAGTGRGVAARRVASGGDGPVTIRLSVRLNSFERRLTSAYLNGDQWPLRTVTLTVSASASDARTGRHLADMDVPALNLAGNSTYEAVVDYLSHDFKEALSSMLAVACNELPATAVASPAQAARTAPRDVTWSRNGVPAGQENEQQTPSQRLLPGRHIAIVIGVSTYRNVSDQVDRGPTDLTNLRYADKDALEMSAFLRGQTNAGRLWDVRTMVNGDATKAHVADTLREVFEKADPHDVIMLFFAGHGRTADTNGVTLDVVLQPYDFDPRTLDSGLSFNWIKYEIEHTQALQVIAFVDACNSGTVRIGARNSPSGGVNVDLLNIEKGIGKMRTLVTSTSSGQYAYETPELKHGVFTYFLLNALEGKAGTAVLNTSQTITLGPVMDYVRENVSRYVVSNRSLFGANASQVPTFSGNLTGDAQNWPLAPSR